MNPPPSPWRQRVDALLGHRRLTWALVALALAFSAPTLNDDFHADDFAHQMLLSGVPFAPGAVVEGALLPPLFTFMDGVPDHNRALKERGIFSWWTPEDVRVNLWRPVTVLTHMLDHALAPGRAWVAHVHNLLWFLLVVAMAHRLFVQIEGAGALAGLAGLIYALDDAHGLPMAWIAHRNALICAAFGIAALALHDRWRRGGWRPGALAAPAVFGVGLLAGEATIGALAFFFAHALTLDPERRWGPRIGALAPYAAVVVVWRVIYNLFGHGVEGSGLYIDPVRSPLDFAQAVVERLPLLLFDQWTSFPAVVSNVAPPPFATVAALVGVAAMVALAALIHRTAGWGRHTAFWAIGMGLAAIPLCATFPYNRTLWFVGLGGAGLLAHMLRAIWAPGALGAPAPSDAQAAAGVPTRAEAPRPGRAARWSLAALAILHLGLSGPLMVLNAWSIRLLSEGIFHLCDHALPEDASIEGTTAIFVNANDLCVATVVSRRMVRKVPAPARVRQLTSGIYDIEVIGIDAHTIELRPQGGFHSRSPDQLMRSGDDPLPVGAIVHLSDVQIEIVAHNPEGFASAARATFKARLDDPSLVWRAMFDGRFVPFTPPSPGQRVLIPAAELSP